MRLTEAQLDLENALYTIRQCWPDMVPELASKPGGAGGSAPGTRPPLPVSLLSDRAKVATDLERVVETVLNARSMCPVETFDPLDVMLATEFLLGQASWIGHHWPALTPRIAGHAEVCERWAKGLHVRRFPVAPCPEQISSDDELVQMPCRGILYAVIRQADHLLPSEIRCDHRTDHTWEPRQWDALGRRINGLHPEGIVKMRRALS